MENRKINRLLLIIWLGIFCVSVICLWVVAWITDVLIAGNHTNQWRGLFIALAALQYVFYSIGTMTIFLNRSKRVRNNKWLSCLSFFLVPLSMMIADIIWRTNVDLGFPFFMFIIYIPFILCLSAAYILFLCQSEKNERRMPNATTLAAMQECEENDNLETLDVDNFKEYGAWANMEKTTEEICKEIRNERHFGERKITL